MEIEQSSTLPQGFAWSAVRAGIKASGKLDLAVAVAPQGANAAVMFTQNQVVAAPITVGRRHISATGGREVSFDLADFYHNESRLLGVDTLKRDLIASARVLEALAAGFVAGDYLAPPIADTYGLGAAQEAYRKVAAGAAGRIVLRPQE